MSDNGIQQKEKVIGALTDKPRTTGYRPSVASTPAWAMDAPFGGFFTLASVDHMRRDAQVSLCLRYKMAPIFTAETDVQATDQNVKQFVTRAIETFWSRSLGSALECMAYGYAASESLYQEEDGIVHFEALLPLYPRDCEPYVRNAGLDYVLVSNVGSQGRYQHPFGYLDANAGRQQEGGRTSLWGARHDVPGKVLWTVYDQRYNRWYGRSSLLPAWFPWRLKNMPDGAMENLFKWYYKFAFGGMVMRGPEQVYDDSGNLVKSQDIGRQLGEQIKVGAAVWLTNERDEKGEYAWNVERYGGEVEGQADHQVAYVDFLDKQIQRGIGIPDEVLTHDGSTGGYSRSQVAAAAFMVEAQNAAENVLEAFLNQIVRPLVRLNFGSQAKFAVKVKPLLAPDQPPPGQGGPGQPGSPPAGDPSENGQPPAALQFSRPGMQLSNGEWDAPASWGDILTDKAVHVRVVGPTQSGKSKLAQAIAANVPGKLVIIDPVWQPGHWGGLPAITVDPETGDYAPIDKALQALLGEMKRRGKELQEGQTSFERLTIVFDEVPDTVAELPRSAGTLIRRLAQRGRHANMHLIGIGQSERVGSWGLEGYGDAAENFTTVYLGSKALEHMPALAGAEFPAVLEWRGKEYPMDLERVMELAAKPVDRSRLFPLAAQPQPTRMARGTPPVGRYAELMEKLQHEPDVARRPDADQVDDYLDGEWLTVDSSNVAAIRFDAGKYVIDVAFHGYGVYRYYDVDESEALAFASAPSKGGFVWQRLRDVKPYRLLSRYPARLSAGGRWITIGAKEDEEGAKKGGSSVYIEDGKITKGHHSLKGKHLKGKPAAKAPDKNEPKPVAKTSPEKPPLIKGDDDAGRTRPGLGEDDAGRTRPGLGEDVAAPAGRGPEVADPPGGPSAETGSRVGETGDQPARPQAARPVPARIEAVNKRLDRYANLFRSRGQHEVAGWMDQLRDHVHSVGVEAALESLGPEVEGAGENVQYAGYDIDDGAFAEQYLDRTGIVLLRGTPSAERIVSTVSASSDDEGVKSRGRQDDVFPQLQTLRDKLHESQHLPGLESSEDLSKLLGGEFGARVPNFTPDVLKKLDDAYGEGKWIVKSYGDEAYAGYGIFFPQRVKQLKQDAQNALWAAGQELAKYGFGHLRDDKGTVVGIKHSGGDEYRFGSEEYERTIQGEARHWADKAEEAADSEQAAAIPEGRFMAQPAFPVVGISEEERAQGVTFKKGQEGRVHVVTRDGKAEVVPHSTWLKQEHLPVVFESDETRAMAQAAVDAINALPESERKGQLYAPDIVKTADGFRVVEANPANEAGASGYLQDNPLIIDAYVSHLTGREPAHARFIRKLLTARQGAAGKQLSRDAAGREHKGKGPGGGQFTGKGDSDSGDGGDKVNPGGGKEASNRPGKKPEKADNEPAPSVSPQQHRAVVALARAKLASVPQPTAEAIAAAKKGMAEMGAAAYRKTLVFNSADRRRRREKLLAEFGDGTWCPCLYCGVLLTHGTLEQDKILTTAQGGRYTVANLVPACGDCNKRRSDMPFAEALEKVVKYADPS